MDSWLGPKKRSRTEDPGPSNMILDEAEIEEKIEEIKIEPKEKGQKRVNFGELIIQVQPIRRVGRGYKVRNSSHSSKYRTKWPEKFVKME